MTALSHRLSHWMRTCFPLWRRQRTMVMTMTSDRHRSRLWLVLCVTLGISGGVVHWQIGVDHARPLELGLSLPEQAFADAETTSPARTAPEAEASHPASDVVLARNTIPSPDLATPSAAPIEPITESAALGATPDARVTPPQPPTSDGRIDAPLILPPAVVSTTTQRQRTTRRRAPRRPVARLAPPRGITVVAVASRSALLRLSQGPLVTVRSGTTVQGWTVQRFSPSGMTLAHHDQRTVVPMTMETPQRR